MRLAETVMKIIEANCEGQGIVDYLQKNDDLSGIDVSSLSFIKIVVDLEDVFQIEFEDEYLELNKFGTFSSMLSYVENRLEAEDVNYEKEFSDEENALIPEEVSLIISEVFRESNIKGSDIDDLNQIEGDASYFEDVLVRIRRMYGIYINEKIVKQNNLLLLSNLYQYVGENRIK